MTFLPQALHMPYEWYKSVLGFPRRSFPEGFIWMGVGCTLSRYDILINVKQCFIKTPILNLITFTLIVFSILFDFQMIGVIAVLIIFYAINLDAQKKEYMATSPQL